MVAVDLEILEVEIARAHELGERSAAREGRRREHRRRDERTDEDEESEPHG